MSKKTSTRSVSKKSFQYKPTSDLPTLGKIQTEWNLKSHYYKSENDPQIEKDASKYEKAVRAFVKKYKKVDFTSSANKLRIALEENEKIAEMPEALKILFYFDYRTTTNTNDTVAAKKLNLFSERFRKLSNEALFFPLIIGKISKELQKKYLKDDILLNYRYFLKSSFEEAKHHLTEPEEKILSLRSNTSRGMWADATEKVTSNRKVEFKGKSFSIPEALETLSLLSWNEKGILWNKILDEIVQISEYAEHELTAIVSHDKVSDELRSYKNPYSATVLSYENDEKSVEALVAAISDKGFKLSQKFYKIKARVHKKNKIPYVNKYDSIGKLPNPTFETSVQICRDTFYDIDAEYGKVFDRMLEEGHIDVYPKAGKRGGAFMRGTVNLPTYVMLNHTDDFKSLSTIAHEIGHAIHSELSKAQPAIYEDFSITTAETASTLFEQFVSEKIYKQLNDKQRIIFLHDKIAQDIATVQRQTAFFNFVLEMHKHIREHGLATKEELAVMLQKHLKSYLGPAVEVTERDGYQYVYVPHFRNGFYVYSYAYGHLVSNLLVQKYNNDHSYLEKINQFLHAGGSDTVENIFANIGINTKKVDTFLDSLKTQGKEIKELDKLTRKN